ncbi:hypothetical protein WJX72_012433 [[Myrmecia] bisecta]|uniref:L-threonine 3-dehydrogenase, mitochondrial n=1 Tax=[Myrmecia] bisecta TaxID=41462 RepID=A0AAW1RAF9_9CHLO
MWWIGIIHAGLCARPLEDSRGAPFRSKATSDCTVVAGSKSFPAHQAILAAASPVFEQLFKENNGKGTPVIREDKYDATTMERFLLALYTGDANELCAYDVKWLKSFCEANLADSEVDDDSLVQLLCLADEHGSKVLWEACVKHMSSDRAQLRACLDLPAVEQLFKDDPELAHSLMCAAVEELGESDEGQYIDAAAYNRARGWRPAAWLSAEKLKSHTSAEACAAGLHTTSAAASPQFGGYLRTGQAGVPQEWDHDPRFLVTGASGQIGAELIPLLREKYSPSSVIASDVRLNRELMEGGPFVYCDVQDKDNLARIILENGVSHVVHLATLLSAIGERNPQLALRVNTHGIQNILDLAIQHNLHIYAPSTIAVFGKTTPRHNTPDVTIKEPSTMYGVTKVHQELLGSYYNQKFGVDYRSLRYPGVISSRTMPGGGTTDYAVEIFHAALTKGSYDCFLAADTALPFIYMPDCLKATYELMMAPNVGLKQRTYNVTAMTFTPAELGEAIARQVPGFEMRYIPDFRQEIARTWPVSVDDSNARKDWGWAPKYDLDAMTKHMLDSLADRLKETRKEKRKPMLEVPLAAGGSPPQCDGVLKLGAAGFEDGGGGWCCMESRRLPSWLHERRCVERQCKTLLNY